MQRGCDIAKFRFNSIRCKKDLESALARIDELIDEEDRNRDSEELDELTNLVEHYERKHIRIAFPSVIDTIEFYMDQDNLSRRDLVPCIGSPTGVSELLSGKLTLTPTMARALHEQFGIPAELLLNDPPDSIEWHRFPVKAMARLGWISDHPYLVEESEEIIRKLIVKAGRTSVAEEGLFRTNKTPRTNAKMDPYALKAWCWKVLAQANESPPKADYQPGVVSQRFLRKVARLSALDDGPRRAKMLLAEHGIALEIVKHLPKTYLDGAALMSADGWPVVGLTLRFDRIDNFWFCLLHELAHVGRHLSKGQERFFVDDMSLRKKEGEQKDHLEKQADDWAEEALVPQSAWESSKVLHRPTTTAVSNLARKLEIHPAIVAGKVRYELQNYRLLSRFVGIGEIRRQFGEAD